MPPRHGLADRNRTVTAGLQLHEPLTLDERDTLKTLSARWGAVYRVSYDGHRWRASRKDGTGDTLRGFTPDDLEAAIRADWASW